MLITLYQGRGIMTGGTGHSRTPLDWHRQVADTPGCSRHGTASIRLSHRIALVAALGPNDVMSIYPAIRGSPAVTAVMTAVTAVRTACALESVAPQPPPPPAAVVVAVVITAFVRLSGKVHWVADADGCARRSDHVVMSQPSLIDCS